MVHNKKQSTGFALLMSLIVVSVVVSIGLAVLDLTLKQLRLSTNSKDSETAFHAANAAMECARYWRNTSSSTFSVGGDLLRVECFGIEIGLVTANLVRVNSFGQAHKYSFMTGSVEGITWGRGSTQRCSQIDILVLNSDIDGTTTVEGMSGYIPGYPEPEKECEPDGRCTVIAARGYSRACNQVALPGTVQREVLLEL